jgi:hypothetical protein
MEETAPEPEPAAAQPGEAQASAAKPKPGLAERVKAWGDAATALFKAALLAGAILIVGAIAFVVGWRDLHERVLVVDVSADAEKTLRQLGADIDLRLALLDAINERVAGVQQIVAVQGLSFADGAQSDAVSFKPFGLELSTDDVSRMLDLLLGRPKRPALRLELLCAPLACTDPALRQATLVMHLSGPNGSRNAAFPVVLGTRALGRNLHQAIDRIADLMLEQNEPLIASVLFLNRPMAQMIFADQYLSDLVRAQGAAVAGRRPGDGGCLADLVIGDSLIVRGELAAGIAAERRAGAGTNPVCQAHGETNVVFTLVGFALCSPYPQVRRYAHDQVLQSKAHLAALGNPRVGNGDPASFRVPLANVEADMMLVLENAGPAGSRTVCVANPPLQSVPGSTVAAQLEALLRSAQAALPPEPTTLMQHEFLELFWRAMESAVPRDDLAGRLSLGRSLLEMVRRYEVDDPHPRALFVLEGRIATGMALALFQALDAKPANPERQARLAAAVGPDDAIGQTEPSMILATAVDTHLRSAAIAFQNASATTPAAVLVEPVSNAEIFGLMGDAWYAEGLMLFARTAYLRAVDSFIEAGEPVEQVPAAAAALARWAVVLKELGGCAPDAKPDRDWIARWAQLGDSAPDYCDWGKPADPAATAPVLATIRGLIGRTVKECEADPVAQKPEMPRDYFADVRRRFAFIDCAARKGANDPAVHMQLSAEAINAEIARALVVSQ